MRWDTKAYMTIFGVAYYRILQLVHIRQHAIACDTKYEKYVMWDVANVSFLKCKGLSRRWIIKLGFEILHVNIRVFTYLWKLT